MNKRETIKYKGFKIKTYYDEDAESPKEWGNDDLFLIYDHRDFTVEVKGFDGDEIFEVFQTKNIYEGYWIFPVFAYIHSGVALSLGRSQYPFNDRWGVSYKGFALVKRQKGWTWTRDKAHKVAESLIEEWNQYLSGDVYGYNSKFGGCWGFYGEEGYKYMIEEAKSEIDYHIKKKVKEHVAKVKVWITNKVPLENRNKCKYA